MSPATRAGTVPFVVGADKVRWALLESALAEGRVEPDVASDDDPGCEGCGHPLGECKVERSFSDTFLRCRRCGKITLVQTR